MNTECTTIEQKEPIRKKNNQSIMREILTRTASLLLTFIIMYTGWFCIKAWELEQGKDLFTTIYPVSGNRKTPQIEIISPTNLQGLTSINFNVKGNYNYEYIKICIAFSDSQTFSTYYKTEYVYLENVCTATNVSYPISSQNMLKQNTIT